MQISKPSDGECGRQCPLTDIAAYIDGELSPQDEIEFERHLADCRTCSKELNEQKQFVNALDLSLKTVPELPAGFTKQIVTTAESGVSGLRRRREWLDALFVGAALFFFVLFSLGAGTRGVFDATVQILGSVYAVISLVAHLIFDITTGLVILLRAITSQPVIGLPLLLAAVLIVVFASYVVLQSRTISRNRHIDSGKTS